VADVTEAWTDDAAENIPGDEDIAADDIRGDDDGAVDEVADEVADDVADDVAGEIDGDGIPDEPEVFVEELQAEQSLPAADMPAVDVPETGEPRVDEVLDKLAGIEGRPTTEHVGVYDEVHRGLQDALANLDQG
jgi:hypothetical protein